MTVTIPSNSNENVAYTIYENGEVFWNAPDRDKSHLLIGPWKQRAYRQPGQGATEAEIVHALTTSEPEGKGFKSAVYLDPQAFAVLVHQRHKQVWLDVYELWRDVINHVAPGEDTSLDQHYQQEALDQLRIFHHMKPEEVEATIQARLVVDL